ncbi:hypothetical protein EKG83_10010 [Saccharothrix syringae]|uniref:Transposase n=1 Tax=Saccharothrix syringae TaxID=103733 RepID=A0A5Q0GUX5_SACSY|nr:hypothetical protein EKG83_10010 [Saccharothrix syringae]
MTRDQVLSDQTWERITPLLPTQYGNNRPFRDHRQTIEGLVFPHLRRDDPPALQHEADAAGELNGAVLPRRLRITATSPSSAKGARLARLRFR